MAQFLTGVKSYTVFFLLMMILLHLVPREAYRKYIHFFMGMLLVLAFLSPVLTLLFDSGEFLDMVEYETFQEQLEELQKDTDRIEFLQQDYYEAQCREMTERELEQMALLYDYEMQETDISFTEDNEIEEITMIVHKKEDEISVKKIQIGESEVCENAGDLEKSIREYYGLEEEAVQVLVAEA